MVDDLQKVVKCQGFSKAPNVIPTHFQVSFTPNPLLSRVTFDGDGEGTLKAEQQRVATEPF